MQAGEAICDPFPHISKAPLAESGNTAFSKVWPTLLLFFLVIGGIYSGVFTPTEAAGFGAVGALAIGVLMRRLSWQKIGESLLDTVQTTSMIFLILIGAILFSAFLSLSGTPSLMGNWVVKLALTPLMTIALIVVIYLILGAFLDTMAMIILVIAVPDVVTFLPELAGQDLKYSLAQPG